VQFDLLTEWRFDGAVEPIWALLREVESWPLWWPSVRRVETLRAGGEQGLGAVHRIIWVTALPHTLAMETRVVALDEYRRIEAEAQGDLVGQGIWTMEGVAGSVLVRYRWTVSPRKAWMRWTAGLLRPLFSWNHDVVMERGRKGLVRALAKAKAA
jgi:hypothetical protein